MPTISATVHQLLRYFFVGVIAAFFVLAPPRPRWWGHTLAKLKELAEFELGLLVIAAFMVGCLIYIVHRVLIYEALFRIVVLSVYRPERWWAELWPYGNAARDELRLEVAMSRQDRRERFFGWASEIHLIYAAIEIALFTLLCWPGWAVDESWRCRIVAGLLILAFLVGAWDRHGLLVMAELAGVSPPVRRQASASPRACSPPPGDLPG